MNRPGGKTKAARLWRCRSPQRKRLEEYARLAALDAEREQTLLLLAEQEKQSADGRRAQEAEAAHLAELTARRKELHAAAVELERETAAQETLHRHLQEL